MGNERDTRGKPAGASMDNAGDCPKQAVNSR
jgi:hypothetical protein